MPAEHSPSDRDPDNPDPLVDRLVAQNNWSQCKSDLATATTLYDAGIAYAAVFFAQQAAEKALRAGCIVRLAQNPRGHNLMNSANSLHAPLEIMNAAAELNADFLTSRVVEAAGGVPAQLYDRETAARHLAAAQLIVDWVRVML